MTKLADIYKIIGSKSWQSGIETKEKMKMKINEKENKKKKKGIQKQHFTKQKKKQFG